MRKKLYTILLLILLLSPAPLISKNILGSRFDIQSPIIDNKLGLKLNLFFIEELDTIQYKTWADSIYSDVFRYNFKLTPQFFFSIRKRVQVSGLFLPAIPLIYGKIDIKVFIKSIGVDNIFKSYNFAVTGSYSGNFLPYDGTIFRTVWIGPIISTKQNFNISSVELVFSPSYYYQYCNFYEPHDIDYDLYTIHHYLQFALGIIYYPLKLPLLKINAGALYAIELITHDYDESNAIEGNEYSYRRPFSFTVGFSFGLPYKQK